MAFIPQIVFAVATTRFLSEPATSGDVLKRDFLLRPSASTRPTPTAARRQFEAACDFAVGSEWDEIAQECICTYGVQLFVRVLLLLQGLVVVYSAAPEVVAWMRY